MHLLTGFKIPSKMSSKSGGVYAYNKSKYWFYTYFKAARAISKHNTDPPSALVKHPEVQDLWWKQSQL